MKRFISICVMLMFSVQLLIVPKAYACVDEDRDSLSLSFRIDQQYIVFPVDRMGETDDYVTMRIDGEWFDYFGIKIAEGSADYYAALDLSQYQGKKLDLTFHHPRLEVMDNIKNHIYITDTVPGRDSLYKETLRPNFHFTASANWFNDPNGLFYLDGVYHMYYQYNPYGWHHLNMHWGHATSKDLIHWEEQPTAIFPLGKATACTGSTIVDVQNTSGLQKGNLPPVLAIYARSQRYGTAIEYSNDGGYTFNEYDKNPIMGGFGDPNILWYEPDQHWVMVHRYWDKGVEGIAFYTSKDLKHWEYQSFNAPFHTCPVFFPLEVEGRDETKWVLHDGHGEYHIGDFDGKVFTPLTPKKIFSSGYSFMASQTFNNMPESDGRRIRMSWAWNTYAPGMPFNQCMNVPTELKIREINGELQLCAEPVKELEMLQTHPIVKKSVPVKKFNRIAGKYPAGEYRLKLKMNQPKSPVTLKFNGLELTLDPQKNKIFCKGNLDNREMLVEDKPAYRFIQINDEGAVEGDFRMDGDVELDILVDKLIVEVFVNRGEVYMPMGQYFYPVPRVGESGKGDTGHQHIAFYDPVPGMKLITEDKDLEIKSFELYTMESMWKNN